MSAEVLSDEEDQGTGQKQDKLQEAAQILSFGKETCFISPASFTVSSGHILVSFRPKKSGVW